MIESYHNQIKSFYLERTRNMRVDRVVYLLSQIVVTDYHQEHLRVFLGFQKPSLTDAEKKKLSLANAIDPTVALSMIETINGTVCNYTVLDFSYYNMLIIPHFLKDFPLSLL